MIAMEYLSLFLALLLPLVLLGAWKANRNGNGAGHRLPPGPWRLPVIGSLHHLVGKPHAHRAMADLARRHSAPLMHLQLGEVTFVVASSPSAAREILRTHESSFASRPSSPTKRAMMSPDGAGLASAPDGAHWRQLRRIYIQELLSARRVRSFRRVREEEVSRLVAAVGSGAAKAGEAARPANVCERAAVAVADAAVRAIIGDRFQRRDEYLEGMAEVGKLLLGFSLADLFPSSRLAELVSGTTRRAEATRRKMFELMDCTIRQHQERRSSDMENEEEVEDILGVLLRIHHEQGYEIPLTMGGVKDIILDLFLAGTETSAATLQWAMSELVRNPRTLQKAQAELREKLQGRATVTEDDLPELSYLKLVIKETLRLHPAAPLLIRECGELCTVLGYDVPRGAHAFVNSWAINRDPEHWGDNAAAFWPERFEVEGRAADLRGAADLEFITFGAGRRMCPGVAFAGAVMELALAAMLYHFDWELPAGVKPGDVDMEEETGVVVRRKKDLYLCPVVRVPPPAAA